ncbi:unnamed protein product [Brachionus calyciflorus]|uniref:Uncharacterized protein n=1 Tax=Brachionus calyciflorus TaxID=104777 RepID=A0A814J6Z7_9BILA|nr:unnamed protein product [Brachionus calyciflorus]
MTNNYDSIINDFWSSTKSSYSTISPPNQINSDALKSFILSVISSSLSTSSAISPILLQVEKNDNSSNSGFFSRVFNQNNLVNINLFLFIVILFMIVICLPVCLKRILCFENENNETKADLNVIKRTINTKNIELPKINENSNTSKRTEKRTDKTDSDASFNLEISP